MAKAKDASLARIKPEKKDTSTVRCATCGKEYPASKQDREFPYSYSSIYAGNNNRLTTCHACIKEIYKQYCEGLRDDRAAFRRLCMKFDVYYNEDLLDTAKQTCAKRNSDYIFGMYMSVHTTTRNSYKTYDTTISEESLNIIEKPEEVDEIKGATDDIETIQRAIEVFGSGYTPDEYVLMINHYDKLMEATSGDNFTQESLILDLCDIKAQQKRLKESQGFNVKEYETLTKLYQSTLSTADLKPKTKSGVNANDADMAFGEFIELIENHCPAEYVKEHPIFDDMDGMDEYYKRFIIRPTENLVLGTDISDDEFSVEGDIDDE